MLRSWPLARKRRCSWYVAAVLPELNTASSGFDEYLDLYQLRMHRRRCVGTSQWVGTHGSSSTRGGRGEWSGDAHNVRVLGHLEAADVDAHEAASTDCGIQRQTLQTKCRVTRYA